MTDNEDLSHVESRSDLLDYKDRRPRDPHHRFQFVKPAERLFQSYGMRTFKLLDGATRLKDQGEDFGSGPEPKGSRLSRGRRTGPEFR